jgi:hypothetical protein
VYDPTSRRSFTGGPVGLAYPPLTPATGPVICPTTTPVQFDPPALKASIRTLLALEPERIYLTHYGMVETPRPLGERLLTMVDDYVALAETVAVTSDADALEKALMVAMREYLFRCAREHGCEMSDEQLEAVLGLDIQLNSQGLAVWLQSRSG